MSRLSAARLLLPLSFAMTASAQFPSTPASTLPAARPTGQAASPSQSPPVYSPTVQSVPVRSLRDQPPGHAQVSWSSGKLLVVADNSSLNQILREISHQTGMAITGGVQDERVFGNYGPAQTGDVLAALLEGTGSNMILKQSGATPQELVLTPRQGHASPPSPMAQRDDQDMDAGQRSAQPERPPFPFPAPPLTNIQSAASEVENGQQPEQPAPDIRTPQQIYDQLMRLQQQRAAPPPQ